MNSNEKRWIVLLVAVVIIVVILVIALVSANNKKEEGTYKPAETLQEEEEKYVAETEEGIKINISEELKKPKMYGELEISNISYTYSEGMSLLLADVTNKGTKTHEVEIVKLTIIGETGEIIGEAEPVIGRIEAGETEQLNASIWGDISNAKDFKIEKAE